MKNIILLGLCMSLAYNVKAQSSTSSNWQNVGQTNFIGYINNFPLLIKTNNTTRMHINGNGTVAAGVFTDGFIGIGTNNPISPLHIVGNQQANAQGWRRGLTLSYNAAIQWDGDGERGFFMAHPSGTPNGNWYAGINSNQLPGSPVEYAFSVYVNDIFNSSNPIGTTQFFKNVLVYDKNNIAVRFGINTQVPQQAAVVYSNGTNITFI